MSAIDPDDIKEGDKVWTILKSQASLARYPDFKFTKPRQLEAIKKGEQLLLGKNSDTSTVVSFHLNYARSVMHEVLFETEKDAARAYKMALSRYIESLKQRMNRVYEEHKQIIEEYDLY